MPIPEKKPEEKPSEFIDRCMSDQTMITEFPNKQQRLAVCSRQLVEASRKKDKK